ncbi:MAG: M1 family aminopeptidase [Cellulophaga sp.]
MWYEIFRFEIKYRAKRLDTYIYFAIVFLSSLVAVDFFLQGSPYTMKENAPYIIAKTMTILSAFFMMLVSMIMGVSILRDFNYKMESLLFVNPIKKRDYLLGRFLGSFVVLLFIFSGVLLGFVLSEFMPWKDPEKLIPFNLWNYVRTFIYVVLPNLFFGGTLFFVSGALSRKLIVVYTQGVLLLTVYLISMVIGQGGENKIIAGLLDPFSFQTFDIIVEFWSPTELNNKSLPLEGLFLYNRIFWIAMGSVILVLGYFGFSYNVVRNSIFKKKTLISSKKENRIETDISTIKIPVFTQGTGLKSKLNQLLTHTLFYFKSILKEVPFLAIVICGMAIIGINSISLGTFHGVNSFPTTYLIIEELKEMALIFFLIILIFYSGELVWKERDVKLNLIYDALPVSDLMHLTAKFLGLLLIYVVLILGLIVAGILFQTANGYYNYEIGIYFTGFFIGVFPYLVLFTFVSFFMQVITNHKFLGHLLVILFFVLTIALQLFGFNHSLIGFGGNELGTYSDMNGYGHFLAPYFLVKTYWMSIAMLFFIVTVLLSVRGTETSLKKRFQMGKLRFTPSLRKLGVVALLVFVFSGGYIYYNTNILNTYLSSKEKEEYRVAYEKTLKNFEYVQQPKMVAINLTVEIYPKKRDYTVEGRFILVNTNKMALDEVHIQKRSNDDIRLDYIKFDRDATLNNAYEEFDYYIYKLNRALQPGDSIRMEFKQTATTKGLIEQGQSDRIVENGTFLKNDLFPTIGYNSKYELKEKEAREEYNLPPRKRTPVIDGLREVKNGKRGDDGYEINFEIVLGTDIDQIALAPGTLQKEWIENNRKYFHYKMYEPMINFYSIVSARYEEKKDKWIPMQDSLGRSVDLEIYYHKGHGYNVDRMMKSMKRSFDYYSENLGPYPYQEMRIMEYPRYAKFAQSFPGTVPFSEAIGFILNVEEKEDLDMPFFVTAHELAHQWWGLQLIAANVQGRTMILESLAQYSALMVMKRTFSKEKVQQFLQKEMQRYIKGRLTEEVREMPLSKVESGQEYIYYGKGMVNLYALQDYISEDSVNLALRRFLKDWNGFDGELQTDRYATTNDLLGYFKEVTPDSLQYVIEDLFETITLYDNKTTKVEFEKISDKEYKIDLSLETIKYRVDSLGKESPIAINDWIDVGVYVKGADGQEELIYFKKHKIILEQTTLEIMVNKEPSKAGIDPLHKLIDRNRVDNVKNILNE